METLLAEKAVIGCILIAPDESELVYRRLSPKMFSEEPLQLIFNACMKLHKRGESTDVVTIEGKLGIEYRRLLLECAETVPSTSRLSDYVAVVIDRWREREMIAEAVEISTCGEPAAELARRFRSVADRQEKISGVLEDDGVKDFVAAAADFLTALEQPDTSIKTGWSDFDRIVGGLRRKSIVVIAARPGKGKTDFALQLAAQVARSAQVSYNSMEMPAEQLLERMASRGARINSVKIRDRQLSQEEKFEIARVLDLQSRYLKINFDEEPAITADVVIGKIAKYHPDVLFIDHLGLMGATSQKKNQWEQVAQTAHALKAIALEHNVCIVELVQLNRSADERKARMGDLYGGAAVEQDADVEILLEVEHMDGFLDGDQYATVTANIVKNRHGGTGELKFSWQPQYHSYRQVESRYE